MESVPKTRYAKTVDGVHIAYQVVGDGPRDLVLASGTQSHLDLMWEQPLWARFLSRLASFSRLVLFDRRGVGASDRRGDFPTYEVQMDDVRTVMDAAASERAALCGVDDGGQMCLLFAATHPERTSALITYGSTARLAWAEDYEIGASAAHRQRIVDYFEEGYGSGRDVVVVAPSLANDEPFRAWWAWFQRMCGAPGDALAMAGTIFDVDVRAALSLISVPTLVLHRSGDRFISVRQGRYLADHILGSHYVELPGDDHFVWVGDSEAVTSEIQDFLTGQRPPPDPDRVLSTVLFTDIVGSTTHASAVGDQRWRGTLDQYDTLVKRELDRHRGKQIKTTGDGTLATFDGPARAIRCACAIRDAVRTLGLELRSGLHTGEVELRGDDVAGIAVVIGQRVSALAGDGEVLVSSTVKDLVAGSGITLVDRGSHALKGVPDEWRLFAADG